MSKHTDAAPEDEPRPSLGHVAIGAPSDQSTFGRGAGGRVCKVQPLGYALACFSKTAPTPDAVFGVKRREKSTSAKTTCNAQCQIVRSKP